MRRPTIALALAVLATLAACSQKPAATSAPAPVSADAPGAAAPKTAPAGDYVNDPAHSSLTFTIDHLGFSAFHRPLRNVGRQAPL